MLSDAQLPRTPKRGVQRPNHNPPNPRFNVVSVNPRLNLSSNPAKQFQEVRPNQVDPNPLNPDQVKPTDPDHANPSKRVQEIRLLQQNPLSERWLKWKNFKFQKDKRDKKDKIDN